MVILDVMNYLILPKGRYPENFVMVILLEVCQEGEVLFGVLGGRCWFLTGHFQDLVIPDVIYYHSLPQGIYPESFAMISLLKVYQEWG